MFAAQGKGKGFDIPVVQPAQSPDLNIDPLVFFRSLQDVLLVAKITRKELLQAVETCWHEYPAAKMRSVLLCTYGSFHGILKSLSGRDNNYQRRHGGRQAHSSNQELDDLHDPIVSWRLVKAAGQKLAELEAKVSEDADLMSSRIESSSNSDEE